MASDWNEAAARKRLADYDAELDAIGEELQGGGEPREFGLFELRAKLETWCWHDQRCAFAEIDRLRAQVEEFEAQSIPDPHRKRHQAEPCHVCKARKGERHGSYCSVLG